MPVQLEPSHTCPTSQRVVYMATLPSGDSPAYTVPSAQTVPVEGVPTHGSVEVVTVHVLDVVPPTVTVAVLAVVEVEAEVCFIAIVSPVWKPLTADVLKAAPLRDIAVQPVPHVAVKPEKAPDSVTVFDVIAALVFTPV